MRTRYGLIIGIILNALTSKNQYSTQSRQNYGRLALDIAVDNDGNLLYSELQTKTVNKMNNRQTTELIRLQGWTPNQLCVTSTSDLLVTMYSDDKTQSKVSVSKGLRRNKRFSLMVRLSLCT